MIDDYSEGDYNKDAFGSDNDNNASIHTSESEDVCLTGEGMDLGPTLKSSESTSKDEIGNKGQKNEVSTAKNEEDAGYEPSDGEVEKGQKSSDDEQRGSGGEKFSPVIGGRPIEKCTKQVTIGDCTPFYERK